MIKHIAADILKDPNFVSEFVQNLSPPSLVVSSSTPTAVQFLAPFVDALVPAPFNPVPDLPPSCPVVSTLISTPIFFSKFGYSRNYSFNNKFSREYCWCRGIFWNKSVLIGLDGDREKNIKGDDSVL